MMSLFFRCLLMFVCSCLWLGQLNAQPSATYFVALLALEDLTTTPAWNIWQNKVE